MVLTEFIGNNFCTYLELTFSAAGNGADTLVPVYYVLSLLK